MQVVTGKKGSYRVKTNPLSSDRPDLLEAADDRSVPLAARVAKGNPIAVRGLADEARSMREIAAAVPDAARWLVPVLDEGVSNGVAFLVIPAFDGTLRSRCGPGTPLLDRLDLLAQACEAVARLNRAPLARRAVHRNLTPSAFLIYMVDGHAEVRLTDHGRRSTDDRNAGAEDAPNPRQRYAPPEQALPLYGDPEPTLDVFALGAIIYEALVGEGPPEAAASAHQWLTPAARELTDLWARRDTVGTTLLAHCEKLRALPIDRLLRFDVAPALLTDEEARLHSALEERLVGVIGVGDIPKVADEVVRTLLPLLRLALHPDPRERPKRAGDLADACHRAAELVRRRAQGLPVEQLPPPLSSLSPSRAVLPTFLPEEDTAPTSDSTELGVPPASSSMASGARSAQPAAKAAQRSANKAPPKPAPAPAGPGPSDLRRAAARDAAARAAPASRSRAPLLIALLVVAGLGLGGAWAAGLFGGAATPVAAPYVPIVKGPKLEAPAPTPAPAPEAVPTTTDVPAPATTDVPAAPPEPTPAADVPAPAPAPAPPAPAPAPKAAAPAPSAPAPKVEPKPVPKAEPKPPPAPVAKAEPAPPPKVEPKPAPKPDPVVVTPPKAEPKAVVPAVVVVDAKPEVAAITIDLAVATDDATALLSWVDGGSSRGKTSRSLSGRQELRVFVPDPTTGERRLLLYTFEVRANGTFAANGPMGTTTLRVSGPTSVRAQIMVADGTVKLYE